VITKVREKASPVIAKFFASKEVISGDLWKIDLNVSDPNGEKKIFTSWSRNLR